MPVIGIIDAGNESAVSLYYVKSSLNFHSRRCDSLKLKMDLFAAENTDKRSDEKASCLRAFIDLPSEENQYFNLHRLIKDPKSNKVLGFVCLIQQENRSDDVPMTDLLNIVSNRLSEDILWYREMERQAKSQKALEDAVDVQTIEIIEQKEKLEKEVEARKFAESKLLAAKQRAEKSNLAKSHFLANMSHEIRTPLNGIIGASSLLSNLTHDVQQQKYIETILHSGQVLLNLVNDILDLSKIEDGDFSLNIESFSLRKLLHELIDTHAIVARRKGIDLVVALPHNQADLICVDRTRLRQILDNLISNAIKFTDTGGVYVYAKLIKRTKNSVLNIQVKDTGIGIAIDQHNGIWERFSQLDMSPTRKTSGFGLGLAITAKLLSLMKGRIYLESELGKGSQFNCWIPIEKAVFSDSQIRRRATPVHILVKNPDLKKSLAQMLSISTHDKPSPCSNFSPEPYQTGSIIFDHAWLEEYRIKASFDFGRWLEQIKTRSYLLAQNAYNDVDHRFGLRFLKPIDFLVNPDFLKPVNPFLFKNMSNKKLLSASSYKILMAEDNPINIKVGLDMLKLLGANVSLAQNGKVAVYKACEENFDLILMDCFMPEMDGVEAMQTIKRSINNSPPIIAVTANAVKGEKERYLSLGFDDYLAKPYRLDDLQNLLYKCFA
jgi:signal transduction histidine kinase